MVQDPLQHMGFTKGCIWSKSGESQVYAQGYGSGYDVIFNFKRNLNRDPTSLANRIVTSHRGRNNKEDVEEQFTFASRFAMREQLWKAVREIRPQVIQNEHDLKKFDSVIDLDAPFTKERGFGPVEWHIYAHPLSSIFLLCLSEAQGSQISSK
jgi:phosphopantetheinyl transferase (holo-ACP synthase)